MRRLYAIHANCESTVWRFYMRSDFVLINYSTDQLFPTITNEIARLYKNFLHRPEQCRDRDSYRPVA